jgi:hypothetical protein
VNGVEILIKNNMMVTYALESQLKFWNYENGDHITTIEDHVG